ncbi:protein hairy [Atheta coriaria]|uniref:protein hairy n=1 Tax=Dalotia coriaria TaxID=877792 RepID=UPI0031F3BAF6
MVTESGNVAQSAITSTNNDSVGIKRSSDRRSNKPIMEKRRRARINNCLNQLKTLILDAMKKDPARHSKLEKADILEMTVKYLQNVQHSPSSSSDSTANKFRAGFAECASEVQRFPGLDAPVKRRLLKHLATSMNSQQNTSPSSSPNQIKTDEYPINPGAIIMHNGVQLVQTRLPNGDIALMFPNNIPHPNVGTMPLLVPIPTRTSSTSSASSSSSHYSSSPESPEPMEVQMQRYSPPMQKPLSLVMRKDDCDDDDDDEDDEKVWRPW